MADKSIGVGIIGFGVIAGQVARVLTEKQEELSTRLGCNLELKRIKALPSDLAKPLVKELGSSLFTTDDDEFFNTKGMDIVVEAIGGEQPAFTYLSRALQSGKHAVTSNKEVVAKNLTELLALTDEKKVALRYEASVGGGVPLILPFQHALVANDITAIYAIINGTTNYVLSRMASEGLNFSTVLKEAQQLGYAEANPTNDIEGTDAVYKLAILASLAFKSKVTPQDIYAEGISGLESCDFHYADELGYAIKLLAIAKQENGSIEARVHPVFIPKENILAKVDGVYNAVMAQGDLVGRVMFMGEGAGPDATSSAVVADVMAAAGDIAFGGAARERWKMDESLSIKPMPQVETRYYFRLNIADKPGVLAEVSRALGIMNISISAAIQKVTDKTSQTAEIVIMTHPAKEEAVQQAILEIEKLEEVKELNNCVRVEEI
jgi:homoserine dehydrogenase